MASSHVMVENNTIKLNSNELKQLLKRENCLHTKSVLLNLPPDLPVRQHTGIGISQTDKTASLDELLSRETSEVLNRAAKQIAGYPGEVDGETVDMVVDILVNRTFSLLKQVTDLEPEDHFACTYCWELMYNPATLPCGHTFCKSCLSKLTHCKFCKTKIDRQAGTSTNIISTTLLQKLYPMEYIGRSFSAEADEFMKKSQFQEAILKYMDAMEYVTHSSTASVNRAKAFAAMGNLDCALQDAASVTTFTKNSPEVHLFKGEILLSAKKDDDALMSFLSCVAVDPSNSKAVSYVKNILKKHFSLEFVEDTPTHAQKRSKFCDIFDPNKDRQRSEATTEVTKGRKNFSGSSKEINNESLLSYILKEIECSILSNTNFAKYLAKEGKDKVLGRVPKKSDHNLESSDLECSLCMLLYLNPVCTPCGHSFCQECLERVLDHGTECPLCKSEVSLKVSELKLYSPRIDNFMQAIIKLAVPKEYSERLTQHENEVKNLISSTPVFVCTLAYPTLPCPLHIFEPRYRLLLRRVLDIHDKEFGICSPAEDRPFSEFGTIVKIDNVSFFPDGRSVVESTGLRRFQVLSCGKTDGYDTAKIKSVVDKPAEKEEERIVLMKLLSLVYNGANEWYGTVETDCKSRIVKHFGNFPVKDDDMGDNGPKWLWWLFAVLPIENKIKLTVSYETLLRKRLLFLHRILACLKKRRECSLMPAPNS